jgi:hypothetical protein
MSSTIASEAIFKLLPNSDRTLVPGKPINIIINISINININITLIIISLVENLITRPDHCSEVVAKVKDFIAAFCIESILSVGLRIRNSRAVDSHEVQ